MFHEPNVFEDVAKGIQAYLKRKGIASVSESIGKAVA